MMNRRAFLQAGSTLLAAAAFPPRPVCAETTAGSARVPLPTPAQQRWQACELGALFHLDLPVVVGDPAPNNDTRRVYDPKRYNPAKLDTDQWVTAAKAMGARYAVFTATHFNGFMQWQSDLYPYSLKYAAWRDGKGDIVADFVASCRRAGILPGLYLSTHRNAFQTVWGHYVDWGQGRGTAKQDAFNRIAEKMTEELCSRYGDLVQIWFDAGVRLPEEGGPDVIPIFEKCQPDSVFYNSSRRSDHRWIGNEEGHAGYPCWSTMPGPERGAVSHNSGEWRKYLHGGDPDGTVWSPGMVDIVMRGRGNHDWFWRPGREETQYTVEQLMRMYDASVGRNCNLIVGLVVNNEGLVPENDVRRAGEFGRELARQFGAPLAETHGTGSELTLSLPAPARIDRATFGEAIAQGERIRQYTLEGRAPGGGWQVLSSGQSVGQKRIERFPAVELNALRLRVTASQAEAALAHFRAYTALVA